MMDIRCQSCGETYTIDETKIKADAARVTCRKCQQSILVVKGEAQSAVSDSDSSPPAQAPPIPEPEPETAAPADLPSMDEAPMADEDIDEPVAIERTKVRFGMATKVIIVMLLVSLLPLGVFWFITVKDTSNRLRQETEVLMEQTATGLASQVDEWLDKNIRVLQAAAKLDAMVSMQKVPQEHLLKTIAAEYPWAYLVFTVNVDGLNTALAAKR